MSGELLIRLINNSGGEEHKLDSTSIGLNSVSVSYSWVEKKWRPVDKYDNHTSHHSSESAGGDNILRVYYIINNINSLDSIYSIIAQWPARTPQLPLFGPF